MPLRDTAWLDGRRGRGDAAAMNRPARPLVATRLQVAVDRPVPGTYDPTRQLRLDENGRPIVAIGPVGETVTLVKHEPPDPSDPPMWLFETATKVISENPDDALAMTETETRVINEEPDDAVAMTEAETRAMGHARDAALLRRVTLTADDSVTGIVAF